MTTIPFPSPSPSGDDSHVQGLQLAGSRSVVELLADFAAAAVSLTPEQADALLAEQPAVLAHGLVPANQPQAIRDVFARLAGPDPVGPPSNEQVARAAVMQKAVALHRQQLNA